MNRFLSQITCLFCFTSLFIRENVGSKSNGTQTMNGCSKPCLNGGECVTNACVCKNPFTGTQCQFRRTNCLGSPEMPSYSLLYSNTTDGEVKCYRGFKLKDGRVSYRIVCAEGVWHYDEKPAHLLPKCLPICSPECQNGGTCYMPGRCSCPRNFKGDICEEEFCEEEPPTSEQVLLSQQSHRLCPRGFELDRMKIKMSIKCVGAKYKISFEQIQCDPVCNSQCQNEGICVKPNECLCANGFHGDRCHIRKCVEGPLNIRHSVVTKFSMREIRVECKQGFKLINGNIKVKAKCIQGNWTFPPLYNELLPVKCRPVCVNPCVNGGRCIAPDVCNCAEGFTGSYCEKRYWSSVSGKKCIFPFQYKGQTYFGCTDVDHSKPWCPTEVHSNGNIKKWEMCFADFGRTKLIQTANGTPCQIPFTGGEMNLYHDCIRKSPSSLLRSCPLMKHNSSSLTFTTEHPSPDGEICLSDIDTKHVEDVVLFYDGSKCEPNSVVGNRTFYEACVGKGSSRGICEESEENSGGKNFCLFDFGWRSSVVGENEVICQFPFVFKGIKVYGCVYEEGEPGWCATKTDDRGFPLQKAKCLHVYGRKRAEGKYSLSLSCDSEKGNGRKLRSLRTIESSGHRRCIFPFQYEGEIYYECRSDGRDIPWCPTEVDEENAPVESNICLPQLSVYFRELLEIQQAYKGLKSEENLKKLLEKTQNLNQETFLNYIGGLGWQRFVLMLKGVRVFDMEPHEGMTLKYPETDEYLQKKIKEENLPSEGELKEKGIGGILNLFGRSCCLDNPKEQTEVDSEREKLDKKFAEFLKIQKLPVSHELATASVISMRDFDMNNFQDPMHIEDFPNLLILPRSLPKRHSVVDYFIPSSVSEEVCEPFLHEGRWRGFGSCVRVEGHDTLKCAVVTNQKYEPKVFSDCKIQKETDGFWTNYIEDLPSYSGRKMYYTKRGERCSFPFLWEGVLQSRCLTVEELHRSSNYSAMTEAQTFCPTRVDGNFSSVEMFECSECEETSITENPSTPSVALQETHETFLTNPPQSNSTATSMTEIATIAPEELSETSGIPQSPLNLNATHNAEEDVVTELSTLTKYLLPDQDISIPTTAGADGSFSLFDATSTKSPTYTNRFSTQAAGAGSPFSLFDTTSTKSPTYTNRFPTQAAGADGPFLLFKTTSTKSPTYTNRFPTQAAGADGPFLLFDTTSTKSPTYTNRFPTQAAGADGPFLLFNTTSTKSPTYTNRFPKQEGKTKPKMENSGLFGTSPPPTRKRKYFSDISLVEGVSNPWDKMEVTPVNNICTTKPCFNFSTSSMNGYRNSGCEFWRKRILMKTLLTNRKQLPCSP